MPAARAISETLAENSLKLISLRGVLEHHLNGTRVSQADTLTDGVADLLLLMDGLL